MNKKIQLQELGIKDYKATWDFQEELFKEIVDIKIQNRNADFQLPTPNFLLFVEHPHVILKVKVATCLIYFYQKKNWKQKELLSIK